MDKVKDRRKGHRIDKGFSKECREYYDGNLESLNQANNALQKIAEMAKERESALKQAFVPTMIEQPVSTSSSTVEQQPSMSSVAEIKETSPSPPNESTLLSTQNIAKNLLEGVQWGSNIFHMFARSSQCDQREKFLDTLPIPNF